MGFILVFWFDLLANLRFNMLSETFELFLPLFDVSLPAFQNIHSIFLDIRPRCPKWCFEDFEGKSHLYWKEFFIPLIISVTSSIRRIYIRFLEIFRHSVLLLQVCIESGVICIILFDFRFYRSIRRVGETKSQGSPQKIQPEIL